VKITEIRAAARALQPIEAVLVGSPAVAGWIWMGGGSAPGRIADAAAITVAASAIALAACAWNDRADVVRGLARYHRRRAVRELAGGDTAARWLLWLGCLAAAVGLAIWARFGWICFAAAATVVVCGWLYSSPALFGKGRPVLAAALHLAGGAGNALAGAAAVEPSRDALGWAVCVGLLFFAAHRVHVVAGREEDRAAGVATAATEAPFPRAALGAARALIGAMAAWIVVGLMLSGSRGAGLALAGAWMVGCSLPLAWIALRNAGAWTAFQGRCRGVVAAGVIVGIGYPLWIAGSDPDMQEGGQHEPPVPHPLAAGIECLEQQWRSDPPWPTYVRWSEDGAWESIHSVFTTSQALIALAQLPSHPRIDALADEALDALHADRNDDGTWSFYGRADRISQRPGRAWDITPDADDTARAALALRAWGRPVDERTYAALASQVEQDGIVRTWFAPPDQQKLTDSNRPDPVVAAAVARALDTTPYTEEVERIRAHLSVIREQGIPEETTYYRGAALIGYEIDLALSGAAAPPADLEFPAGLQGDDGCWPLQPSFYGAQEAGRPAYGSVVEPTAAGLLRAQRRSVP